MEKQDKKKQQVLQINTPGKTKKTKGKTEFQLVINPDRDPNLMKESKSFLEWLDEEGGAGDQGTGKLTKKYKKDTPCAVCGKTGCKCVNEGRTESADRERYKVMTRTGAKWYTKRRRQNILSKQRPANYDVVEHVSLTEEDTSKIKKVLFLAQQGLVKPSELNKYKITIRKLLQTKTLTQDEKDYLNSKYDDLLSMIVSDPQLYQRFRVIIQ